MANDDHTMRFSIATPRTGPQLAQLEGPRAGGDPVRGNAHMSDGAGGDSLQPRQAQGLPSSFAPARDRSNTPRRGGPLAALRSGSSPPERERALGVIRQRYQRQTPSGEQYWMECTEAALNMQRHKFEEVANSYMLETKQAFQTERAAWQQSLLAEEQRLAAHGRHEANVEINSVEHQMLESFKRFAMQQSVQFQQTATAEQQQLALAAKAEIESSRRDLLLTQTRFQESGPDRFTGGCACPC